MWSKLDLSKLERFTVIFHLCVCFQTSVHTLGKFHKNGNNSTVFEELAVSIVDLTDYFFSGRNLKSTYISSFICMFSN
jgi:hypothetical protein